MHQSLKKKEDSKIALPMMNLACLLRERGDEPQSRALMEEFAPALSAQVVEGELTLACEGPVREFARSLFDSNESEQASVLKAAADGLRDRVTGGVGS